MRFHRLTECVASGVENTRTHTQSVLYPLAFDGFRPTRPSHHTPRRQMRRPEEGSGGGEDAWLNCGRGACQCGRSEIRQGCRLIIDQKVLVNTDQGVKTKSHLVKKKRESEPVCTWLSPCPSVTPLFFVLLSRFFVLLFPVSLAILVFFPLLARRPPLLAVIGTVVITAVRGVTFSRFLLFVFPLPLGRA